VIEVAHHFVSRSLVQIDHFFKQLSLLLNFSVCIGDLILLLKTFFISLYLADELLPFLLFGVSVV